jgi:hypothetical protein
MKGERGLGLPSPIVKELEDLSSKKYGRGEKGGGSPSLATRKV